MMPEVPRRRQAALVVVQHVKPGQHVPVQRRDPDPQLAVKAKRGAIPAVESLLVVRCHLVEHDEDARVLVLHHGGKRALPAHVLAAEREAPAVQPAGAGLR